MTAPHLCQLAGTWNRTLPDWCVGEVKHDGFRALWLRDHQGNPKLFTRNGHEIPGTAHVAHELLAFERHAGHRLFVDGEYVVGEAGDTLATTKRWVESGHRLGGTAGTFWAFDGFAYDDWMRGGTATPLYQRKARIEAIAAAVTADEAHRWEWRPGSRGAGADASPVRVVPHVDLWHVDDALQFVAGLWRAGLEGAMFKDAEAGYVRQRSQSWMKCGRPWQSQIRWKEAA